MDIQSEEAAGAEVLGADDVEPGAAGDDPDLEESDLEESDLEESDFVESDFPDPVLSPPDCAAGEPESFAGELLAASRLSLR